MPDRVVQLGQISLGWGSQGQRGLILAWERYNEKSWNRHIHTKLSQKHTHISLESSRNRSQSLEEVPTTHVSQNVHEWHIFLILPFDLQKLLTYSLLVACLHIFSVMNPLLFYLLNESFRLKTGVKWLNDHFLSRILSDWASCLLNFHLLTWYPSTN